MALAWSLCGTHVEDAWLMMWHRRVLKHPDGSEPSDLISTDEIRSHGFFLAGDGRKQSTAVACQKPHRRRDGLKQVDEALAKNDEGGTGRLAT